LNHLTLIIVIFLAVLFVFPIYWMAIGSFEPIRYAPKYPPDFYPVNVTLRNYKTLFGNYPCFRWILNSFIVASSTTIIAVSAACLAGYAFAKKRFPGRNFLFWLLLSTVMIPFYVRLIPLFMTMTSLGLYDTYPGIFLPLTCQAGNVFLARQYMATLPSELIDAAKVDGASELSIFTRIILPLSKPLIAALVIFNFVWAWRSFLWPLIATGSDEMRVLPMAVAMVCSFPGGLSELGMAMAGTMLVTAPICIVFIIFQRYFIKGITLGGVKI